MPGIARLISAHAGVPGVSGVGCPRRGFALAVSAGFMLLFVLVAVPLPARALSGEQTLEIHNAFVITYSNISGSDTIWWDWQVTGRVVKMTFWIILSGHETTEDHVNEGASQLTIHKEFTSKSSGHIHLRDGYHTATVKWSCHALQYVTFRYHVMLNPPDMTFAYSVVAAWLVLPFVAMALFIRRYRLRKTRPDLGPSGV